MQPTLAALRIERVDVAKRTGVSPVGLAILVVLRSLSDIAINGRGPAVVE